jgi:Lrp/AsnC family transcriptional regulator, leucine-responsive regulatory protein
LDGKVVTVDAERRLDDIDWQLVVALQQQGRASFRELGQLVGLSPPATAERVRRLEEAGVITGYRAQVDVRKLERPLLVHIRSAPPDKASSDALEQWLRGRDEVLSCAQVTGADCFHLTVAVRDSDALRCFIDGLMDFGPSTTSLVLASTIDAAVVGPPTPSEPRSDG